LSTGEQIVTVITPTLNSAGSLPRLIESLQGQTDRSFEWIVSDGGSTDGTVGLVNSVPGVRSLVISEPDFGIYDALNRALQRASGSFYVVAGADDCFDSQAIANFRKEISRSGADIIVARAMCGARCFKVKQGPAWIVGEKAFIGNHSVATAFRKDLHLRFGNYSRKFPIAADSLFVLQASQGGARRAEVEFVAGEIGGQGVSSADWVGSATELFRVQLICGRAMIPQLLLLVLRLIKGRSAAVKAAHNAVFR
jgi:glycosyltransferase involved in cell wall biosynthesis